MGLEILTSIFNSLVNFHFIMFLVIYFSIIDVKNHIFKIYIKDSEFCLPCWVQIHFWIVICLSTLYIVFFHCIKFVINIVKIICSQFYTSDFHVMTCLKKYSAVIILCLYLSHLTLVICQGLISKWGEIGNELFLNLNS